MPEWMIIAVITAVVVLSRLKSINIEFKDNNQASNGVTASRKRLKN
jgi:hypothetical protein